MERLEKGTIKLKNQLQSADLFLSEHYIVHFQCLPLKGRRQRKYILNSIRCIQLLNCTPYSRSPQSTRVCVFEHRNIRKHSKMSSKYRLWLLLVERLRCCHVREASVTIQEGAPRGFNTIKMFRLTQVNQSGREPHQEPQSQEGSCADHRCYESNCRQINGLDRQINN